MYDKLLLEKDGGIIDEMAQAAQDNCAVLCIGLGGTGIDCLRWVKKKVYNRLRPDSRVSSVPEYKAIKFLAVDTDKSGIQKANAESSEISKINLDTEFFDISIQGHVSKLLKGSAAQLAANPNYRDWLRYDDIDVAAAKFGAGGVRMLGRYLLALKASEFVGEVKSLVSDAMAARHTMTGSTPKVYIHIFTGMGGGTGAGTFLDVCYLVKYALADKNPQTCGYFFLPDVNLSRKEIDAETKSYIAVNGYASLQSLDYCMNFEHNGDKWSQRYAGVGMVEFKEPPVDLAHLITAQNAQGAVIENAYDYAMNVVTEYFMLYVSKVEDDNFTLDSTISNFVSKKSEISKYHGARYEYLVLGASSATLPYKEILTYLAAALFARFAGLEKTVPNAGQLDEFIKAQQLEYPALRSQITQGCNMAFPMPDYKWKDVHSSSEDVVANHFQKCRSTAVNQLEANFSEMSRDLQGYYIVSGGDQMAARSVITKIFNGVSGVITDPSKGPFYAAALVNGVTGKDLLATIDGHLLQVQKDIAHERSTMLRGGGTLGSEFNASQSQFFSHGSKKNYEEYVGIARLYNLTETRIEVLVKLEVLLRNLRKQVSSLADLFTTPLRDTIEEIMQTFQKNLVYLNALRTSQVSYEYPLFTVQDVRENLDTTIREMNRDAQITNFMNMMIGQEGLAAWQGSQDRNKVAMVVTTFFTRLFHSYSSKTMTEYLHDTYGTNGDPIKLIQKIRDDAMEKLDSKATPLFWQSSDAADERPSKTGYINVPDACSEVKEAANKLILSRTELALREAGIKDRITIIRFYVGIPLFCYEGCLQYEINYAGSHKVGRQPYEGKKYLDDNENEATGPNWLELPSVVPLSVMKVRNSKEMTERAKAARELYKKALEAGIIQKNGPQTQIVPLASDFVDAMRAVYEAAKDGEPDEKLEAQAKIKDRLENSPQYGESVNILSDATDTGAEATEAIKEQVRIDHFAAAPALQELAATEIKRHEQLAAWIAELEPKIDTDLADYALALFTGVLAFVPPEIKMENEYGEVTELSTTEMSFGSIPLYQGFQTYKDLPERARQKIVEAAVAARKTAATSEEVRGAVVMVNEELGFKKDLLATARQDFQREYADIRAFLDDIEGKLKSFVRPYRIRLD